MANLREANLSMTNIERANIRETNLKPTYLTKANLHGENLKRDILWGQTLIELILEKLNH